MYMVHVFMSAVVTVSGVDMLSGLGGVTTRQKLNIHI